MIGVRGDARALEPMVIGDRQLFVLPVPCELDGTLSAYPATSRGFTCLNTYLVSEPGHALLLDPGYSIHEQVLGDAIASLLEPRSKLTVWALRIGEFASICNVRPFVERFDVDALYGSQGNPPVWVDFRPEYVPYGSAVGTGALADVEPRVASQGMDVKLGDGARKLQTLAAPLRLLPTNWLYDEATRTLFTADAFAYASRPTAAGPWAVTAEDDPTTPEQVWDCLAHSRFWWLPGARTEPIRTAIARVFEDHDVDRIAPACGCVIEGPETVRRHVAMLDDLLAAAEHERSIGIEVGRWQLKGAR